MEWIFVFIPILVCLIALIITSIFQSKSNKKYKEVLNLVKNKEGKTLNEISSSVNEYQNDTKLMEELYSTYLEFQNKFNNYDDNFDGLLCDDAKDYYVSKLKSNEEKRYKDIKDKIDLISYTIVEYKSDSLSFRLKINCFEYKLINDKIISGSNKEKVEQVLIITFVNQDKWLIKSIEKAYESKIDNKI